MQLDLLNCFALPAGGNPALVVRPGRGADAPHWSDPRWRQDFARARAWPACVFIDADPAGGPPRLDYYYPHARSPLCLHATLAAAAVLGDTTVLTAQHGQPLALQRRGADAFVQLAPQPAAAGAPDLATVRALLAAPGLTPARAPVVRSVGSPKLLVEVADRATLLGLRPDLAALTAWGRAAGVNGIYAWCTLAPGVLEGRNFNHLDPALEDCATGVAAGALTVLLERDLRVHQGGPAGRPCLIHTERRGTGILVGGRVQARSG